MRGPGGPVSFELGDGQLEISDDRAVFFPTHGQPALRSYAIQLPTNAFGSSGLTPDQIRSILRTINELNGANIKNTQRTSLIQSLRSPGQQIVVPTTDGSDPAWEIDNVTTEPDGTLSVSCHHGNNLFRDLLESRWNHGFELCVDRSHFLGGHAHGQSQGRRNNACVDGDTAPPRDFSAGCGDRHGARQPARWPAALDLCAIEVTDCGADRGGVGMDVEQPVSIGAIGRNRRSGGGNVDVTVDGDYAGRAGLPVPDHLDFSAAEQKRPDVLQHQHNPHALRSGVRLD